VPAHRRGADAGGGGGTGTAGGSGATLAGLAMDAAVLLDCGVRAADLLPGLQARGITVVTVDGPLGLGVPNVGIDDEGGTRALVEHVAGLGHRDIGVVTLPSGRADVGTAPGVPYRRTAAARAAIAGLPGGRGRFESAERNTVEEGERVGGRLLDTGLSTALVAQSDVLALGCLRAASARGLSVPGDVSVTGFDGVDLHLLEGTRLTTVEQPSARKGQVAAQLVLAGLEGERPTDVRLPISLRIGTTTGPAPTPAP